ncbi:MAG: hypothetical protein GXY83_25520 [Rhodopirellula sp.]|nr:hypothetical protein [Rhodopirellula sp.]
MKNASIGIIALLVMSVFAQVASSTPPNERQARPSPDWLTRGVIYQVWLRTFTPEGTLKAAANRLAEVADLGATVVYLSPVQLQDDDPRPEFWSPRQQKSPNADPRNPYRVKDYDRIDPEYGTETDLQEFVAKAHKHGLRVLMDVVYHHTGPTCVLLKHPEFFQLDAEGKPAINQWNFLRLNLESPRLREYLTENMIHWVKECGVDGFRCDVSGAVPLDFWEAARERLDRVRSDLVILAEGLRADDQVKAFDINYSFAWYHALRDVLTGRQPAEAIVQLWEKQHGSVPRGARFIRYTDNHDIDRSLTLFGERGVRAASVLHFTIDGVPFLYNGQEIGDTTPQDLYHHWPINWEAGGLPRQKALLIFLKTLIELRRNETALTAGSVEWLKNDRPDSVLSFRRRTADSEILSVVNLSNRAVKVRITFPEPTRWSYDTLIDDGAKAETDDSGALLHVTGFGYFVAKRK